MQQDIDRLTEWTKLGKLSSCGKVRGHALLKVVPIGRLTKMNREYKKIKVFLCINCLCSCASIVKSEQATAMSKVK